MEIEKTPEQLKEWESTTRKILLNESLEDVDMSRFMELKPNLFKDDNQWHVVSGQNQFIKVGRADTPKGAILDWNKELDKARELEVLVERLEKKMAANSGKA